MVLGLDGGRHIARGELEAVELVGIEPDAHGVLTAEDLDAAHARRPAQGIAEGGDHVVAKIEIVQAAVGGDQTDNHQEGRIRFVDLDPFLLHLLRQQGDGLLQLVLDLHLGDIGIGAGIEGQGDGDVARGGTLGLHVEKIIQPGHALLDDLGDAVLDGLGRGAGIFGGDPHRWRRDFRILGNGQLDDRNCPCQHDDDGDNPGKNGTIDKKSGHDLLRLLCWCLFCRSGLGLGARLLGSNLYRYTRFDFLQTGDDQLFTGGQSLGDR